MTGCPTTLTCTAEAALSVLATVTTADGGTAADLEVVYDAGDGEQPGEDFSDGTWGC